MAVVETHSIQPAESSLAPDMKSYIYVKLSAEYRAVLLPSFFSATQANYSVSGTWYLCIMYFHTQLSATLLTPPRAPLVIPSYSEEPIKPYLLRQKGLMQHAA